MENSIFESGIKAISKNREIFEEYKKNNQKLQAVKELKELTGLGLREAKDVIDLYWTGELIDIRDERRRKLERLAKMPLIEELLPKLKKLTDDQLTSALLMLSTDELFSIEEKIDSI